MAFYQLNVDEPNEMTPRFKASMRRSSSQFSGGVSTPTPSTRSSTTPSLGPQLANKVTRGEFEPHIQSLADMLKASVRTAVVYDEWPESHVVKVKLHEWLWKTAINLVKEDSSFTTAYNDLAKDSSTRNRLLQYVCHSPTTRSLLMLSSGNVWEGDRHHKHSHPREGEGPGPLPIRSERLKHFCKGILVNDWERVSLRGSRRWGMFFYMQYCSFLKRLDPRPKLTTK